METQLSDEALEMIASRFKLLSDPMRLRILHTLGREEMTVSDVVAATRGGQANISKHLGFLLEAGVVSRRKEGLNAFYKVSDETIFELCETVCNRLETQLAARKNIMSDFASR
jgi:DNA-binding transcriptional ArsR family regulator